MPFVEAKHETVDEYLLRSHTDYLNMWASVHDEGDFTVPQFLRNCIMKKVVEVASLKDLLDKYKIPGLAMSYDVEFDDHNSWTAGKQVNIYEYPANLQEHIYFCLWQQSKDNELRPHIKTTEEGRIISKPMHEITKDWMNWLSNLPPGKDKVLIQTGEDQYFEYERLVEYPSE